MRIAFLRAALLAAAIADVAHAAGTSFFSEPFTAGWTNGTKWLLNGRKCACCPENNCQVRAPAVVIDNTQTPANALRLNAAESVAFGSMEYVEPQLMTSGIDISFRFAIWGGSGANGMTFFLRRGSESDRGMGPTGGSLGYAADQYSPAKKGMKGGLLAVMYDVYGTSLSGDRYYTGSNCNTPTDNGANVGISIRGAAGSDQLTGYCRLAYAKNLGFGVSYDTMPNNVPAGSRATRIRATRIAIDPSTTTNPQVKVYYSTDGNFSNMQLKVSAALPAAFAEETTFTFGFAGITGGATNHHEIVDLDVGSAVPLPDLIITEPEQPQYCIINTYCVLSWVTSGGYPPYTISLSGSGVPTGMTFSTSSGNLTGTPTVAGTYTFTVTALDKLSASVTASASVEIVSIPPSTSPTRSPSASASLSVSVTPSSSGSRTASVSSTVSSSVSSNPTTSRTGSVSGSVSSSETPSSSVSSSITQSVSASSTASTSPSVTASSSSSTSPSVSASSSSSTSPTVSTSSSTTPSVSLSASVTASRSVTASVSRTPSVSPSVSRSPSASTTRTSSVTASASVTSSISVSVTVTSSISRSVSVSTTVTASSSLTSSSSATPSSSMTASSSTTPSITATSTSTQTSTSTGTRSSSQTRSNSATRGPPPPSLALDLTLVGGDEATLRAGSGLLLRKAIAELTGVDGATASFTSLVTNYSTTEVTNIVGLGNSTANSTSVNATQVQPGPASAVNASDAELNAPFRRRQLQAGCAPISLPPSGQVTVPVTAAGLNVFIPPAFFISNNATTPADIAQLLKSLQEALLANLANASVVDVAMSSFTAAWSTCTGMPPSTGVISVIGRPAVVIPAPSPAPQAAKPTLNVGVLAGVITGGLFILLVVALVFGVRGCRDGSRGRGATAALRAYAVEAGTEIPGAVTSTALASAAGSDASALSLTILPAHECNTRDVFSLAMRLVDDASKASEAAASVESGPDIDITFVRACPHLTLRGAVAMALAVPASAKSSLIDGATARIGDRVLTIRADGGQTMRALGINADSARRSVVVVQLPLSAK